MKLYRIDFNVSYLVATDKDTYNTNDVCNWIQLEMHEGELQQPGCLTIQRVTHENQIVDFEDDYDVYTDGGVQDCELKQLKSIIFQQNDQPAIDKIINYLNTKGYTVSKPTKA